MAEKKDPLLDLETMVDRPTIVIDKKPYEIPSPDELSIVESQQFTNWGRSIDRLSKDEDGAAELEGVIDKAARRILRDVPDPVYAKLHGMQKMHVVASFTGLLLAKTMGAAGALAQTLNPSTGAKPSPGSSDSTADRPASGSKKRRARS